jgi:hypothetical protein
MQIPPDAAIDATIFAFAILAITVASYKNVILNFPHRTKGALTQ